MSSSTRFSLVCLLVTGLCIIAAPDLCQAAARLIHVPLRREITQSVGQLGQPVVNYYTQVHIGTPAVPFKVQFDVGLNELFVPHYSWNPFNTALHYSSGFQCKSSSTCQRSNASFNLSYQSVQMTGKRYDDIMTLAMVHSNDSLPVATAVHWRQNFLAISSASDARFKPLPVDGFFGLGPAPISQAGVNNMLVSLHSASQIDNLQFSIWFNPVLDSAQGGELILGGVDTNKYQGQIYWHHLPPTANQWTLALQHVSLGNHVISCMNPGPCQALLSTGSSDIVGPREDVRRLYSLLNTTSSSNGLELIDCRRIRDLPYLSFSVDGIPYYLLSSNYVRKTTDGRIFKKETCYVAIVPSNDNSNTWTLTTPFLGAYYSIYDITYRQIGFAALK